MTPTCSTQLALDELIAYFRGELDAAHEARVEEHLFACASCTARLSALERLGAGVVALVRAGRVSGAVTGDVLSLASASGLKLRTYRLAAGGRVACTAAPEDDFVAIRLALDLEGVESADLSAEITVLESGERRELHMTDLPVDPATRELVLLHAGDTIRAVPRSLWQMRVRARRADGERELGPFTLDHTPWPGAVQG